MAFKLVVFLVVCSSSTFAAGSIFARFATVLARSDSSLAIYAGSNDIVAFSKLEQDKQEEAREVLLNTMLTLSLADVNGGLVLPGIEDMVDLVQNSRKFATFRDQFSLFSKKLAEEVMAKFPRKSWLTAEKAKLNKHLINGINSVEASGDVKAMKILKGASRWFGKAGKFTLKALGPLSDIMSVGLSIWSLTIAVRNGDTNKIISSSLAIASGVIGLAAFVAVFVTGVAVLGPIGIFIGALLGIAATLIELFGGSPINEFREHMAQLNEIKNASMYNIFPAIEFFKETKHPFNDIYVVNQAALLEVEESYHYDVTFKEGSGDFKHSLVHRKPVRSMVKWSEHPDIINASFLLQGHERSVFSPVYYSYQRMGWVKSPFDFGFDFYGQNPNGPEYIGTRVLLETNLISKLDTTRKGVYINTTVPPQYKQDDIIRLGDYENINVAKKVTIDTGPENDAINVDGLVGKLETAYENLLDVDLGSGTNTLNFGGVDREEKRFQCILFEMMSGKLVYIVSNGKRKFHSVGFIRDVSIFSGSPLNDVIIFQPFESSAESDMNGSNVSSIFHADFVVTEFLGSNNYIVDLSDTENFLTTRITIIDHSANQSYITICAPSKALTQKNLVYENRTLHIYNDLSNSPTSILMSISLRFSKRLPKIRLTTRKATFWNSVVPPDSLYHPIYNVNPILLGNAKRYIHFDRERHITGTDDSDLVELKCPEDPMRTKSAKRIDLLKGIDYLLVSLEFIEQCVENQSQPMRFVLSRYTGSWRLDVHYENDQGTGMPSVTLIGVEKIINEHGHVLVNLDTNRETKINMYERYFEETKKQLGISDEAGREESG